MANESNQIFAARLGASNCPATDSSRLNEQTDIKFSMEQKYFFYDLKLNKISSHEKWDLSVEFIVVDVQLI